MRGLLKNFPNFDYEKFQKPLEDRKAFLHTTQLFEVETYVSNMSAKQYQSKALIVSLLHTARTWTIETYKNQDYFK